MAHTRRDKKQILHRIRRIKGQLESVERLLEAGDEDCFKVLQTVAACRGALNGLMAVIVEGHIDLHVLDEHARPTAAQRRAARELMQIVRSYLR